MKFWHRIQARISGLGYPYAKRILVAVIGGTVLLFGFVLIVLPGPAVLVIPAGLAILATEFAWARRWLNTAKDFYERNKPSRRSASGNKTRSRKPPREAETPAGARPD